MQRPAALVEQRGIGHVVGEGVLERVLEVGEEAALVEELRCLEMREAPPELIVGELGDVLEQREGHIATDHRRRLEQALVVRRQAIDPRRQDRLHRGRNLDARERGREAIDPTLAYQGAGLDQSPHADPRRGCPEGTRPASR
jgi:hypothetical protein